MKLIFIINDGLGQYIAYQATGVLNAPKRRSVEIELTKEQVDKINLKIIGTDKGIKISETIESVSLKS